jgi:hypothetical protein
LREIVIATVIVFYRCAQPVGASPLIIPEQLDLRSGNLGDRLGQFAGWFLLTQRNSGMFSPGAISRTQGCLALLLFWCLPPLCRAQVHSVLCTDGVGTFEAALFTKVQVRVGATRKGALAVRSCEATLSWNDQKLAVATDVSVLDLDAFGVDLGLGAPVAAFQIKKSKDDCCMTYLIYSLQRPPKLLRTLTGGSFFGAADTDLDGQVEIWTDDTAAFNGIDNLTLAEFDFAPPMVLRFENGKLLDVSSEFVPDFDKRLETLRSQLRTEDLRDFRNSDGKLQSMDSSLAEQIHRLRGTKAKVLEIVWLYLYSGREQEAWRSLAEMWPASDADRIRGVLVRTRTTGIRTQLDGVSTASPLIRKTVEVFTPTSPNPSRTLYSQGERLEVQESEGPAPVTAAVPILVRSFPTVDATAQTLPQFEITVVLVIDSAGKVRSLQPIGTTAWKNIDLISALSEWKFVPAFKGHRAIASNMVKIFSLQQ